MTEDEWVLWRYKLLQSRAGAIVAEYTHPEFTELERRHLRQQIMLCATHLLDSYRKEVLQFDHDLNI